MPSPRPGWTPAWSSATRSGACRCGGRTGATWPAAWPTSPTAGRRRWVAASPPRCTWSAACPRARSGRTWTPSPGTRPTPRATRWVERPRGCARRSRCCGRCTAPEAGTLQPPLLPRQPVRLDAVAGPELADRLREVVAHRAVREVEPAGDVGRRVAFAGEAQYLALAVGERIRLRPSFECQLRVDRAAPGMDAAQRVGELPGWRVLEQVAMDPRVERAAQVAGAGEGGDDHHLRRQAVALDPRGQLEAGKARHLDVGHQQVGRVALQFAPGSLPVPCGTDHLQVRLQPEECLQRAAQHRLVLGEHDPDHGIGPSAATTPPAVACRPD